LSRQVFVLRQVRIMSRQNASTYQNRDFVEVREHLNVPQLSSKLQTGLLSAFMFVSLTKSFNKLSIKASRVMQPTHRYW